MKREPMFRSSLARPQHARRASLSQNVANALKKRHITLGMVEADVQLQFIKMDGLVPLSEVMDYDAARVYTIAEDEQRKMKVFDAFRRWSLADDERNIRVNYIRPFVTGLNGNTALETNLEYVSDVTRDVASHGYISGRAGVFAPYHSSRLSMCPWLFCRGRLVPLFPSPWHRAPTPLWQAGPFGRAGPICWLLYRQPRTLVPPGDGPFECHHLSRPFHGPHDHAVGPP